MILLFIYFLIFILSFYIVHKFKLSGFQVISLSIIPTILTTIYVLISALIKNNEITLPMFFLPITSYMIMFPPLLFSCYNLYTNTS